MNRQIFSLCFANGQLLSKTLGCVGYEFFGGMALCLRGDSALKPGSSRRKLCVSRVKTRSIRPSWRAS